MWRMKKNKQQHILSLFRFTCSRSSLLIWLLWNFTDRFMTVLFFFSGRTSDVQRQHHLQQHDLFHLFEFFSVFRFRWWRRAMECDQSLHHFKSMQFEDEEFLLSTNLWLRWGSAWIPAKCSTKDKARRFKNYSCVYSSNNAVLECFLFHQTHILPQLCIRMEIMHNLLSK